MGRRSTWDIESNLSVCRVCIGTPIKTSLLDNARTLSQLVA